MIGKLLTEHHLEFLSLKGGCTGSFVSTLVKMPHCWKSLVTAQIMMHNYFHLAAKLYTQSENISKVHTSRIFNSLRGIFSIYF